jgi:hypothetical protein
LKALSNPSIPKLGTILEILNDEGFCLHERGDDDRQDACFHHVPRTHGQQRGVPQATQLSDDFPITMEHVAWKYLEALPYLVEGLCLAIGLITQLP